MSYIKHRKHPVAALGLAMAAGGVAAQTAPAAAPALPAVKVTSTVESDVKVDKASSNKFTAPLIDTPKTVTVIPLEVMQQTAAVSLTDALRMTPGITLGAGEGGNPAGDRPFLRGFDTQSSIYVDGMRDLAPSSREVFNLESVEVSKGPDSTYGGRGGAGGSINLETKKPKRENFAAGSIGVGTDKYTRVTADGNWAFGDSGAFRLNAMVHDADVAGRNGPDNSRYGFAPSLAFGLGTPTRVTLQYFRLRTDDMPDSGIPYNQYSTAAYATMGPVVERGPNNGGNRENFYGLFGRDFRKDATDMGTVIVEHDITSTLKFRNITRASKSSMDYVWTQPDDSKTNVTVNGTVWRRFNSTARDIEAMANQTELSGEYVHDGLKHSFATGLELSREEAENNSYQQIGVPGYTTYGGTAACTPAVVGAPSDWMCTSLTSPNPNDPFIGQMVRGATAGPSNYTTSTVSLYAFDTIRFNPQWLLNAGLRFDRYKTSQLNAISTVNGTPTRLGYAQEDDLINYQLGVVYKPAPNGSVYASVGTSSTPGGNSAGQGTETQSITVANANSLDPEKNIAYEIGTKWDVLDGQLALSGAIFRLETTNARVTTVDGLSEMAGDRLINGIEVGIAGRITRAWEVFGGYTFLDSEQTNAGYSNIGTTAAPIWVPAAATGQQFTNTPRHSASLWTTYRVIPSVTVGGGVYAVDKVYGGYGFANSGRTISKTYIPGYARLDAMASWTYDRNISFQLNVQNLTDKVYYDKAYTAHYAGIAPGRSAQLSANFKY